MSFLIIFLLVIFLLFITAVYGQMSKLSNVLKFGTRDLLTC